MRLLFILFFSFVTLTTYACSAAYQYSLFPLGQSMGRFVILELEMDRYLSTPDNQMMQMGGGMLFDNKKNIEVRWKGTLKLCTLEGDKMVLQKELGFIDLLDDDYQEALLPHFKKAYELAKAMPMFEEAVLEKLGRCHHDRSCDFMTLTIDEENAKFYAASNEEGFSDQKCPIAFAQKTLKKVEMQTKIKFTDFENVDKGFQVDFFRLWSPQTVRRYRIGDRTLQVFTIGRGDKSRYSLTKDTDWKKTNVEDIAHFIQGNDVVFHGQRFDFIQIL